MKGIFGLITAFKFFDDVYPVSVGPNIWDFSMMLLTEISPTSVFVILSSRKTKEATPDENEKELSDFNVKFENNTPQY